MKGHYPRVIRVVEGALEPLIRHQCLDRSSRDWGGQVSPDRLAIRGGFAEHASTVAMRGSEPAEAGSFTIFCTGYTPLDREMEIDASTGEES